MLHFISFGSGSSGNSYFLFTENDGLLIDAGIGVRALKKSFKDFGLHLASVKNILITHDHADHVKSVGSLSRDHNLPVWTTKDVHAGINRNWCVRCKIVPDKAMCVEKGVTVQLGDFTITPFGVPHDSTDNVGYCVECDGVTFVLMTDIGHLTDEMKTFIARADYLVIEADFEEEMLLKGPYSEHLKSRIMSPNGHMSNEDCGNALADNATPRLKHVWLCHLSDENNHPDLAEKTVTQILRSRGIVAGNDANADFALEALKRKTPSGIYELK